MSLFGVGRLSLSNSDNPDNPDNRASVRQSKRANTDRDNETVRSQKNREINSLKRGTFAEHRPNS